MRAVFKILLVGVALALIASGGVGLALSYAPEAAATETARGLAERAFGMLLPRLPVEWKGDPGERGLEIVSAFPWRFLLTPAGLVLLVGCLLPGRGRKASEDVDEEDDDRVKPDARALKKAKKEAARIARKGVPVEAAELCFAVGLLDDAARYFITAGELSRAAEIRHDQNRFLESAELYGRAGRHDAAGVVYAQQEEWGRAAKAYVAADNLSVAAEMYEKAGDDRLAAQCYQRCDFPRHAAKAYIRCEEWELAAQCLEEVMVEEGAGAKTDAKKQAEYDKLVRMAGSLFERARRLDRAEAVLVKGGAFLAAAEVAQKTGAIDRAAEFFLKGKDVPRAADAFHQLGDEERAARILAEHHREHGELEDAARHFEAAGELLEAGDLYRSLEKYAEAAACYERFGDHAQAAEMWNLAGDRAHAAESYERAGLFAEAAELCALAGDTTREAELLEKSGDALRAGQIHLDAGRIDEAIGALQKVAADRAEFAAAAALLGRIFNEREQYPLAIAKLREAVGEREIERQSLDAFYGLATAYEANGDLAEARDLYEKILAFEYRYQDAAERLERVRARIAEQEETQAAAAGAPAATSGRYIIRGTLGRGGMGIVYKAEDTVLDRVVAFKVLPDALKENPQALKNFLREAKSAAQLNHPGIVTVYDAGEQDGSYYIAMEYVDGNTLKDIIKRRGKIAPRGIVHVLAQMCEALAYAHEKKIVHRDIKTANTMWTKDRKAKIMDFGLAKVIEEVRNHTTVVSGTPYYMSPEQTLGQNVDHRSDLYSLGVSLFEMATGTLPFTEGNLPYHHVHTPPPHPQEVEPGIPEVIANIIVRCLRKDPAERYQSARAILAELRAAEVG